MSHNFYPLDLLQDIQDWQLQNDIKGCLRQLAFVQTNHCAGRTRIKNSLQYVQNVENH